MNWTRISAITEVIGTLAIVATLLYLAIQTQQNTLALRTQIRQETLAADIQLLLDRANNPERQMLWCKENLTPVEQISIMDDMIALIRMREAQWLQHRDGVLDEATWHTYRDALIGNLASDRRRTFWDGISQDYFVPEFVSEINVILETASYPEPCEVVYIE